jgi:hypothetical protein
MELARARTRAYSRERTLNQRERNIPLRTRTKL